MSACLKLATTSKFKPGGEEALQKLGAALFKELLKEADDPREEAEEDLCLEESSIKPRGLPADLLETSASDAELHLWSQEKEELTAEISSLKQQLEALESTKPSAPVEQPSQSADPALEEAGQRVQELEEENQHLKKEFENLNAGMAYAKNQFHKLKAVKDEKVAEVVDLNQKVDELNKLCGELESSNFESNSHLNTLKLEMQQLQDTNANLLEALDEGRDKESALQETLREMESELGTARKNLNESESLTDELQSLREQVQVKDEDLSFLREQLNFKDAQVNTLRIESEAKDVDLNDFAERLAKKDADINFINGQLQEKETDVVQLKDDLEALTQQRASAESRIEELQVENSTLATDKESLMNKMRHAKQQFEKLKKVNEERGKQIAELKVTEAQLDEALLQIDNLKAQVENEPDSNTSQELYDHIATLESEMQNIQEQLESANTERLELQTQLTNAAAEVSEADSQTEFLRSQLEGSLASLQKLEDELNDRNSKLHESSSQVIGLQEDLQRLIQEREGAVQLQAQFHEATTTIEQLNQALFEKDSAVKMQSEQILALEGRVEELSIVESQLRDAHSEVEKAAANVLHLQTCVAERDDELALRSKEVTNLNAELIQLPEIQQAANRMQAQLDDIIPKYQAMEQDISNRDHRMQELESRAAFVDDLQKELGSRDELITSHSEEIAKLEAEKQQVLLDLEDTGRKIGEMEAEMNEAFEIAELADSESQKANAARAEAEEQLRVAHQNVTVLEGQISNMQAEMSSAHAELDSAQRTLESQAKTEVELQSTKVRLEVADGELQRLRQELVELESAKKDLTVVEGSLRTAEAVATSLRQQLEASQEHVKELLINKDQVEDVAAELQAARNESDDLRQQLAESKSLVASVREEQEQASASMTRDCAAHQDLRTEYQQLQQELYVAQNDLSTTRNHLTASGEEVNSLRQKVMQLETAFAVGVGTGSQSGLTSFGTPQTHVGSPASNATPVQGAAASGVDPSFQMKLDSISKQLADARLQESALMGDLESLRTELEHERKLRSDAQAMLEQTAIRTTSGASNLQISMDGGTNKKDEDVYDVEAAVLSGGDASGFQPISGLIKGLPFMNYLKPLIKAAEAIDKGFIVLMRQPALRFMLLTYFVLLHIIAFLIGRV